MVRRLNELLSCLNKINNLFIRYNKSFKRSCLNKTNNLFERHEKSIKRIIMFVKTSQ